MCVTFWCTVPLLTSSSSKPSFFLPALQESKASPALACIFLYFRRYGTFGGQPPWVLAPLATSQLGGGGPVASWEWHVRDGSLLRPVLVWQAPRGSRSCMCLSWQKLCTWFSEIAAFWLSIMLCGLKGKPKLGGTQKLEPVLDCWIMRGSAL